MERKNGGTWIRRTIVLSPEALKSAQEFADIWYAGNLSAFFAARIERALACEHCARNNSYKVKALNSTKRKSCK